MKSSKIVAIAICAAALLWCAKFAINYLADNKLPSFEKDADIYIRPEMDITAISAAIIDAGARWPGRVRKVLEKHDVAALAKPGHYTIKAGKPAVYAARMINNGWQTPVHLTLSGTLRDKGFIAKHISMQMMADSADIRDAMSERIFEELIPDTYEVYWTDSPEDIFKRLKREADTFWNSRSGHTSLSRAQAWTLASIVSAETNSNAEMPLIAGVYLNRLAIGMKLQADPTVAFCYNYKVNRILRPMLSNNSPYNTYRHAGLPPGPICVPTKKAVEAVLNPDYGNGAAKAGARGCNLYFCADPSLNGTHRFASSYAEHLRNARAYTKALDSRR